MTGKSLHLLLRLLGLLCLDRSIYSTYAIIPSQEIFALQELYDHTHGETWRWRDVIRNGPRWNFTQDIINPCCDSGRVWQGITCDLSVPQCCFMDCHISTITLDQYRLRGNLEISWQYLMNVSELSLSRNFLTGSIPYNLTQMSSLQYLDLSIALLSGSLPSYIGSLSLLSSFDITSNSFSGPIPAEIGSLTNLISLRVSVNSFSSFPSTFSSLRLLTVFEGYSNNFAGPMPSVICQLSSLKYLSVYSNKFTGLVPSIIGSLTSLTSLSINSNFLEGSLLPLASLKAVKFLSIQRNRFTGHIPIDFGNLTNLRSLYMYQNLLTGSIPDEMRFCTNIEDWYCWGNGLSGSIPGFLGNFSNLKTLDFASNYFTGSLPKFSFSTNLQYLNLNRNYLNGNIPEEISSLLSLDDFQVSSNYLSGSIPSSLPLLTKLTMLNLRDNRLKGTLPQNIGNLTTLGQLYLQGNKLSGKIDPLFSFGELMKMTHLDLSDNTFNGQIPESLFKASLLSTLALTSNCFSGQIPSSICKANRMSVLSMDGLSAANDCQDNAIFPITNIPFGNSMSGEIPHCVFNIPNLTVLSMTANGLSGSLPKESVPASLVNLSLSHNHLTGDIPLSIQQHPFVHLDLSYNQLSGEYAELGSSSKLSNSKQTLILEVNRLSGKLPSLSSTISHHFHLNILTGNVFSCDQLPENDENKETYQCGSSVLDTSIYTFMGILFFGIFACSRLYLSQPKLYLSNSKFLEDNLPFLECFHSSLLGTGAFLLVVAFLSIVMLIPIYSYRMISSKYSTHSHLYRWSWTTAYLTGTMPAGYLLGVWFVLSLITVIGGIRVLHHRRHLVSSSNKILYTPRTILVALLLISTNISIVSTINGLYIFSTFQKQTPTIHYLIQLALALFKWTWSVIIVPVCYLQSFNSLSHKSLVRLILFVLNNIIIPSIVAMLNSPSCYKGLLVQPDEIVSGYTYQVCDTTAVLTVNETEYTTCVAESSRYVQVVPLVPPFSYNYMCSSTVLTAYIPVFIYIYCLEMLAAFIFPWLLLRLYPSYSSQPTVLLNKIPAFYWRDFPEWVSQDYMKQTSTQTPFPQIPGDERVSLTPLSTLPTVTIMKAESIFIPLIQNMAILLTFGINSSVLAVAIASASSVQLFQYYLTTARFVDRLSQSSSKSSIIQILSQTFVDPTSSILDICWTIILVSCIFISLLCWDIAGDEVGWKDAFYIPILGLSFCVIIYIISYVYMHYYPPYGPLPEPPPAIVQGKMGDDTLNHNL